MKAAPDLLLIYYDNTPTHMDAFLKSLLGDLHISVGPATIIAHRQHPDAMSLGVVLVAAVVHASKHLEQRSLELDGDRTTYNQFESRSPQETKLVRGHVFRMYARRGMLARVLSRLSRTHRADGPGSPGGQLHIGMPFDQIVRLLGKPDGVNQGTEMLEPNPRHTVAASGPTRQRLARTQYCMWKRPEGTYLLVVEDGKLASISMKP